MTTYRNSLPQSGNHLFLTDGGIETTLIFHEGLDLPYFAAFHLLGDTTGRDALVRYYERYIAIAKADGLGFILESPDMARKRRLGRQAWLRARRDRDRQPSVDRTDARLESQA